MSSSQILGRKFSGIEEAVDLLAQLFVVPQPPGACRNAGDVFFVQTVADEFRGNAADGGIGRNVLRHDSACGDNRSIADGKTGHDSDVAPDPDIIADGDGLVFRNDIEAVVSPEAEFP